MTTIVDFAHRFGAGPRLYKGESPTLATPDGGHHIPYALKDFKLRRLTPIECERLQGFPDDWTAGISDTQRYKLMGNAVTVNVIEAIGSAISKASVKMAKPK